MSCGFVVKGACSGGYAVPRVIDGHRESWVSRGTVSPGGMLPHTGIAILGFRPRTVARCATHQSLPDPADRAEYARDVPHRWKHGTPSPGYAVHAHSRLWLSAPGCLRRGFPVTGSATTTVRHRRWGRWTDTASGPIIDRNDRHDAPRSGLAGRRTARSHGDRVALRSSEYRPPRRYRRDPPAMLRPKKASINASPSRPASQLWCCGLVRRSFADGACVEGSARRQLA